MRQLIVQLIFIILASVVASGTAAADPSGSQKLYGQFYYDSETDRYFTTSQSQFAIRPVEDQRYLDRIEVSIDNDDFKNYGSNIKFDDEGLHIIRFRAADPILNWSPMQQFRVYVDKTPPKTFTLWQGKTYNNDGALYVSPNSQLIFQTQDNLSGVEKTLSLTNSEKGEDKVSAYSGSAQFKREGDYSLKLASVDRVGNREEWKSVSFKVDGTSPATKAEVQGFSHRTANALFVNSASVIKLESQDLGSGIQVVEYQINGGPTTHYQQPLSPVGSKMELRYRAIDFVGNAEEWKSITVYQDTKPPKLSVDLKGRHIFTGGKIFAAPGFAFAVDTKDTESGLAEILVSQNGESFKQATQKEFRFDQPGEFKVAVRAKDNVGNLEESNPYTVVIDKNPPTSTVETTNAWIEKGGVWITGVPNRIDFRGTDAESGLSHIEISYDGKTFSPVQGPLDVAQWRTGKMTFSVRAVDRLGNAEPAKKYSVAVRTEGPKVDLFVEGEGLPNVPLSALKNSRSGRSTATASPSREPDDSEIQNEKSENEVMDAGTPAAEMGQEPVKFKEEPSQKSTSTKNRSTKKQTASTRKTVNKKSPVRVPASKKPVRSKKQ